MKYFFLLIILAVIGACLLLCESPEKEVYAPADDLLVKADSQKSAQRAIPLFLNAADLYLAEKCCRENWQKAVLQAARWASQEDPFQSIRILEEAVQNAWWPEDEKQARMYQHYGYYLRSVGDFYRAKSAYEQARKLHESHPGSGLSYVGQYLYKPLANIYTRLGENEKALYLLNIGCDSAMHVRDTLAASEILADWGIALWDVNKQREAIEKYDRGLQLLAEYSDSSKSWVPDTKAFLLTKKAISLKELGAPHEGVNLLQDALVRMQSPCPYLSNTYSALGEIYRELEDWPAAEQALKKAINEIEPCLPNRNRREIAKLELMLAGIYLRQNKYGDALGLCRDALSRVLPDFGTASPDTLPPADAFYPENTILESLTLMGEIMMEKYYEKGQAKDLGLARKAYERAIQMEEYLRDSYAYQSSQLYLIEQSNRRHEQMMEVLYQLWHHFEDETAKRAAYVYAEKSKAVLLHQKLANNRAVHHIGIEQEKLEQEKKLQSQLSAARTALIRLQLDGLDAGSPQVEGLKRQIQQLTEEYHEQVSTLEEQHPEYYQLKYNRRITPLEEVQHTLLSDTSMLVEYFYGVQSKQLYRITVTKSGVNYTRLPFEEDRIMPFLQLLRDWAIVREKQADPEVFTQFVNRSSDLYHDLLPPNLTEDQQQGDLIIIPDGILGYLPFDLLLEQPVDYSQPDYRHLPFLLRRMTIRYGHSVTTLLAQNQKNGPYTDNYLGIAPDYSQSKALANVNWGEESVMAIQSMLGGHSLVDETATLENFLNEAPGYRVIHFHGHAKALDSIPLYSWLAFTYQPASKQTGKKSPAYATVVRYDQTDEQLLGAAIPIPRKEIGSLLFSHHLYNLSLNAELVVLSACETGLGRIARGEGVISLARAFHFAGCPNTVMSLWEVKDRSTAVLMELFFKNLKRGLGKSAALQRAKIQYLDNPKNNAYPSYWGGIVLIGDNHPLDLSDRLN